MGRTWEACPMTLLSKSSSLKGLTGISMRVGNSSGSSCRTKQIYIIRDETQHCLCLYAASSCNMRWSRTSFVGVVLLWQAIDCRADTEIVTFDARDRFEPIDVHDQYVVCLNGANASSRTISAGDTQRLSVNFKEPTAWVSLRVTDEYPKWTVRLSWPGSVSR